MGWDGYGFPKSLTVGERRAKALRAAEKLGRKRKLDPVSIGGSLASTWWGKAWNRNLEGYADYSNRLPRGRSYARHGSVIDLRIDAGSVSALVQGSRPDPYQVDIAIGTVSPAAQKALTEACSGKLDSVEALLGGLFPAEMERLLTAEKTGLFPHPREIRFSCSCPDSASLCKHVAAALYGVGYRLDRDPSLFFRLRKVELDDLLSRAVKEETRKLLRSEGTGESARLAADDGGLGALFGIDLEAPRHSGPEPAAPAPAPPGPIPEAEPIPKRRGRRPGPGRRGKRQDSVIAEVRSALDSMNALSRDLDGLQAGLKALLASGRSRKTSAR